MFLNNAMEICEETLKSVLTGQLNLAELRYTAISTVTGVDHISEPISYDEFFCSYLLPNKPCVLGCWATQGWASREDWVTEANTPNLNFLQENFGEATCPVADCTNIEYDSHKKSEMKLKEFVDYLKTYRNSGFSNEHGCFYLKDWHFQREFPDYKAYSVPLYFRTDWMNEHWDKRCDTEDDYRFVYIGPKGSWTPFHSDVFRSNSWSANICGRKKWIILAPGEENHMRDKLGNLAFDLTSQEMEDIGKYPNVSKVRKIFEVYQECGEVIFVPSGWHHQVFNLEDTISINHNWNNGCNVDICWDYLQKSLDQVKHQISDCKDMDGWAEQCQVILRANLGMNYSEFYTFLQTIASTRIKQMEEISSQNTDTKSKSEQNLLIFELFQINKLVAQMKRNMEFLQVDFDEFKIRPKKLIASIDQIICPFL